MLVAVFGDSPNVSFGLTKEDVAHIFIAVDVDDLNGRVIGVIPDVAVDETEEVREVRSDWRVDDELLQHEKVLVGEKGN